MTITFDGVSSSSLGVVIEGYCSAPIAERSVEILHIPGRNGDFIIDNGSFNNYSQKYTMHWKKTANARDGVVGWLSKDGYRKFIDSNDSDHFRMAQFVGKVDIDNRMDVLERASVEFNFKPQRFLTAGEVETVVTNGSTVFYNPTHFPARPLIHITGAVSDAVLTIAGKTITFVESISNGYIDCDTMEAHLSGTNLNNKIFCDDFPYLPPGSSSVNWTGTISSVKITPRWWQL